MENIHMTPEEFRKEGAKVVDWMAAYYEEIEKFPVLSKVKPGDILSGLPKKAPEEGEPFDRMMQDVNDIILPGITHWQSPSFFAYFPANASFPSILGDMLSSGLGVQGMLWATSPAATELETCVMEWLADMLALPEAFRYSTGGGGVIQDTASSSALAAVVAAREKVSGFTTNEKGVTRKMTAYVSTQTHSSVEKAIKIAGVGRENLRLIEVDRNFAMNPDSLQEAIRKDKDAGHQPFLVCATIGTTSSNAMDPIRKIGEICKAEGVWLHVDGAMSGSALICPEFRHFADGLELADSFCFNPHKWLLTNFDCDCFWVADRRNLINTFSIVPEYLRNQASDSGEVYDYRDWHVQLGRRFRSLKLWFVIRHYGVKGLQQFIRNHVNLARNFAQMVRSSDHFELITEPPLNLVCFRMKGSDEENLTLMNSINRKGEIYFTHTRLNGRIVLRMSIAQTHTEEKHVTTAWNLINSVALKMMG
jgi:aromatic-L-amino-acid decarboxylase